MSDTMGKVYEVTRIENSNIYVKDSPLVVEELNAKAAKQIGQPQICGRRIGLFYWNYDKEVTTLDGYAPQLFYPDIYSAEGKDYIAFGEIEDLRGDCPLDRFTWEEDGGPDSESDLRRIILEE